MDIMTSVTTELALWDIFQSTRGANTTALLGGIIAIWVAARFSSVSVDKNVNMVGRIVVTVFAIGVFAMWMNLGMVGVNSFNAHATGLAALDAANGDIDIGAASQAFIQSVNDGNPLMLFGFWAIGLGGLLIAVIPLWVDSSK